MTDWEILEIVGTEQEALLIAGFLESREVPVQVESRVFRQEPVNFGALAQVRLKVPSTFLEQARHLLEARRQRFTLIEGDGPVAPVDVVGAAEPGSEIEPWEEES